MERQELQRRSVSYRSGRPSLDGRNAIGSRELVINAKEGGREGEELCNDEEDVRSDVVVLRKEQGDERENDRDTEGGCGDGFFKEAAGLFHSSGD